MTTLLSISVLLITVMLMQMGTEALGPLDTLSAIELGFSNIQVGIMGAAHFSGFIIGCFGAPALVRRVGHACKQSYSGKKMTSLSASLIFIFAVGTIISPVFVGYLIQIFGPNAIFIYFGALHIVLLVFTGYRALIRPDKAPLRKYVYIPRTSLFIAKTIKSMKRKQ